MSLYNNIYFDIPNELSVIYVINKILTRNGFVKKIEKQIQSNHQKESPELIVKNAAITLVRKTIPEEKITELLAQHLETTLEIARQIIIDLKKEVLPYAKDFSEVVIEGEITETPEQPLSAQEFILQKIRKTSSPNSDSPINQTTPLPPKETVKQVEIKSVEENAEKIHQVGKRGQDTYREPIE